MFEATLDQSVILKKLVEAMKDILTDVNWEASPTGLTMQAMDPSHVSLVAMKLKSESFQHFRCDRNITLGLNIPNIVKVLKCAGSDDNVTIRAAESDDHMKFSFFNKEIDSMSNFDVRLLEIDTERLGIPETEYKSIVKMPSSEFSRIIKDLSNFGDNCVISVTKDGVRFTTSGNVGKATVHRKPYKSDKNDGKDNIDLTVHEATELNFAMRFLKSFANASNLADTVTLSMSTDVPLMVDYQVGSTGFLRFYLAPKVDSGDE